MTDYKLEAAKAAVNTLKADQKIGLGGGTSILHMIDTILKNPTLTRSLSFVSSSPATRQYLIEKGLTLQLSSDIKEIDVYFDGCDQFDEQLNAFKSCGGIHTSEKIIASCAKEFILVGDEGKFVKKLNNTFPLVAEILPEAFSIVLAKIQFIYPEILFTIRKNNLTDQVILTENGNLLVDIRFSNVPSLGELDINIKMIPGVVDHSLFYKMATMAIIAGEAGSRIIKPVSN